MWLFTNEAGEERKKKDIFSGRLLSGFFRQYSRLVPKQRQLLLEAEVDWALLSGECDGGESSGRPEIRSVDGKRDLAPPDRNRMQYSRETLGRCGFDPV